MGVQILLVECDDRPGLVHNITGVLFHRGVNIVGNQEFVDPESARFFMRTEFDGAADAASLIAEVRGALPADAIVRHSDLTPKPVVVLASKEHHCLADLLVRHAFGELSARILAVVSNHEALAKLVAKFELPFHHISHAGIRREEHEAGLLRVISGYGSELVVLAKYMRILSPDFVARFPSRILNIHHSFLPAFVGARPYHQAFQRGVKVIGATAHFVTEVLDDGPIIEQDVVRISNRDTVEQLIEKGRDIERVVLSRGVRWHIDSRVLLYGKKTVVFD